MNHFPQVELKEKCELQGNRECGQMDKIFSCQVEATVFTISFE